MSGLIGLDMFLFGFVSFCLCCFKGLVICFLVVSLPILVLFYVCLGVGGLVCFLLCEVYLNYLCYLVVV